MKTDAIDIGIGSSPAFQRMRNAARMVAATGVPVLLVGEPGSGRSTLAREIHAMSPRAGGPFVSFTCAGAPPDGLAWALESLAAAPAGAGSATFYLDEVAELDPAGQARLFHSMAGADGPRPERDTPSQGSTTTGTPAGPNRLSRHETDAAGLPLQSAAPRVIAATAQDLDGAVREGRFRRDLYLRLCVVPIEVPPLRERVLDIPALTQRFLAAAAARHGTRPPRLSAGAERLFRRHLWPGNVRELANLCERLAILHPGGQILPEHLPRELILGGGEIRRGFTLPPEGIDLNDLEAELIRQALALAGGNKSRAARLLGLTRDTLLYRIQKHLIAA